MEDKINISELRDDVNYVLFNTFNFGVKELSISNKVFKLLEEVAVNE